LSSPPAKLQAIEWNLTKKRVQLTHPQQYP